jgi:hypothetical protein
MTTPFDTAEDVQWGATEVNDGDIPGTGEELAEVDTPPETQDDELDEVPVKASASEGAQPTKTQKVSANPRVEAPEGYIKPVAFARVLTQHLQERGASNVHGPIDVKDNPIPPQQVYSMVNQAQKPSTKNPIPLYSQAHDGKVYKFGESPEGVGLSIPFMLKQDEALAWWDAKDSRVAASRASAAAKKEAAAKKAAEKPEAKAEEPSGPVEEAE